MGCTVIVSKYTVTFSKSSKYTVPISSLAFSFDRILPAIALLLLCGLGF
jgi:hypothetical protein